MSLLKSLLALLFVLLGIVFGAMNRDVMPIDLFFTQLEASIGLTVLLVLLLGCLLGGSVVLDRSGRLGPVRILTADFADDTDGACIYLRHSQLGRFK